MVEVIKKGAYLVDGQIVWAEDAAGQEAPDAAREKTIAYSILRGHDKSADPKKMRLKFDALISHDITFVGIIQTAKASGLTKFPIPYAMTNCHNSLCAVGGTINEDDHVFGLSAAKKYGGIYVPAHQAVIHQYMREMMSGCGKMILGSDSHTRYGALGTMAVGEGGPELVKQLLGRTYDLPRAEAAAVYLKGAPRPGVGPQDVALAIIGAAFKNGFVKNRVMEFVGPGVSSLPVEFRNGVDVMTTETACWSSIWRTDDRVEEYLALHGRPGDYRRLDPAQAAWYGRAIVVDLSEIRPMIALPFHPSNVCTIDELTGNPYEILKKVEDEARAAFEDETLKPGLTDKISKNGEIRADQGIIAGCSGGIFDNVVAAAQILRGRGTRGFPLSVYPGSQPAMMELAANGCLLDLMSAGAVVKTAFCGPCFGAGDTPANRGFSLRHTTRNFPNREGSKPREGQAASVALMDARSIAATAANGGVITSAEKYGALLHDMPYRFRGELYKKAVFHGCGRPDETAELVYGPNIKPWPKIYPMAEDMLLKIASVITDPVTTTDELIPSGETSSLRSNPMKLAQFALSRKDPQYVSRAREAQALEEERRAAGGTRGLSRELSELLALAGCCGASRLAIGSCIFAVKPGDGSAREQAASSQRVLGGAANFALEYATKRYRSNLVNWGMIPFITDEKSAREFKPGEWIWLPGIRRAVESGAEEAEAWIVSRNGGKIRVKALMPGVTEDDRKILLSGCLMNYYSEQ